jgi:hypothetical protein
MNGVDHDGFDGRDLHDGRISVWQVRHKASSPRQFGSSAAAIIKAMSSNTVRLERHD